MNRFLKGVTDLGSYILSALIVIFGALPVALGFFVAFVIFAILALLATLVEASLETLKDIRK